MNKIKVVIGGVEYPCRQTMGAMLRFKQETGKELTSLNQESISELCTYVWCCVKSSCVRDGIPFDMTLMDLADALSIEDIDGLAQQMQSGVVEQSEKKR